MATIIEEIRRGIPWKRVQQLQKAYGLKDESMAPILGIRNRTLTRLRSGKEPLDAVTSDRFYRAEQIFATAAHIFVDKSLTMRWLSRPQPGLAGRVPLETLDTEPGCTDVRRLLAQIEHGVLP